MSALLQLPSTGGNTYYIVVDGYGSGCGDYQINVTLYQECVVEYPSGASSEGETCIPDDGDDNYNGGCNSTTPVFSPITCGETVCGTANTYVVGGTDNYRDTDWHELIFTKTNQVAITIEAEFPA